MPRPTPGTRSQPAPPPEELIDEMVEETFPASDPPQTYGRTADSAHAETAGAPPPERARVTEEVRRGALPTIGNQGEMPASRRLEETVTLSDQGALTLRFEGDFRRLHVYFSDEGLALDAQALDALIAALSKARAQMPD